MANDREFDDLAHVRGLVERAIRRAFSEVAGVVDGIRRPFRLVVRLTLDQRTKASGTLDVLLRADDDPSLFVTPSVADAWWRPVAFRTANGVELTSVARRVRRAGRAFPPLERAARSADPLRVALTEDEVALFLTKGAKALGRQRVIVQLPAELTAAGRARLRARLHVGTDDHAEDSRVPPWGVGAAATEPFRWELAIGDVEVSPEEFLAVARAKRDVVQVRGRWIAVDHGELAEAAKALGDLRPGSMPAAQAAGLAIAREVNVTKSVAATIVARGRVREAAEVASRLEVPRDVEQPQAFTGVLRPYQRRGLAWLLHLEAAGLGGVLADDMGLGKTAQVIALLLATAEEAGGPTLVVCPASVLPNWERELRTFAPSLRVVRHHGSTRARRSDQLVRAASTAPSTVVLTTFATLRSSQKVVSAVNWQRVVVDEAQNIKNPSAAQSRAVRAIEASHRLALTGTPVENRLDDLWSIMQFTNPGLLGSRQTFRERFAGPVERGDTNAAERLRRVTRPFVLRRTKSDPSIAVDLPPKVEADVACQLTVEQATLYQAAVDQALADIAAMEAQGMRRRARILTLLTELKQICDHPALYLHERGPLSDRSGKLDRLMAMLEETTSEGDAALVFTQFSEMGRLIVRHVADELDIHAPLLHGQLPVADRQELVDSFQHPSGPPVMIASLRAGGVGINITRATHVIHVDRWWNPAVEDQATDRAHRIGQTRTVFVHRLQVAGTLEERIASLIDRKRSIAGQVVQAGEGWLTELSTDDLRRLVELT